MAAAMQRGSHTIVRLWRDQDASVMAEYALVLTLFSLASIVAVTLVGQKANAAVDIDESNFSHSMVVGN